MGQSYLEGSSNFMLACSSRAKNTRFKDKPDMIEANTRYLLQTSVNADAPVPCASAPVSLFRTQSESGLACVNEVSASKQYSPPQLTLRRPVVSHNRHGVAAYTLTNSFSSPASGALRRALISGLRKASTHIMPTWASPYPCRLFSFSRNTSLPLGSL